MTLEARSPNCFSSTYSIHYNGRVIGEFGGRWFSHSLDIQLLEGKRWCFRRTGFLSSHHYLEDKQDGQVLAECHPSGWLTRGWDLSLSDGPARLESKGLFNTGFEVVRRSNRLADVDRLSMCSNDWRVQNYALADVVDELLVGLLFHTILRRRRQQNSAASA